MVNYPCLCAANSLSLSSIIFVIISRMIRCIKAKNIKNYLGQYNDYVLFACRFSVFINMSVIVLQYLYASDWHPMKHETIYHISCVRSTKLWIFSLFLNISKNEESLRLKLNSIISNILIWYGFKIENMNRDTMEVRYNWPRLDDSQICIVIKNTKLAAFFHT